MPSVSSIVTGSFGFVRTHVGVIAVWCVVYMVGGLLMTLVMSPADWGTMASPSGGPELPPGLLGKFMAIYAVMIVMFIALYAAVFRAILKPEESSAAYLRLGGDELRLVGVTLIVVIGSFLAMFITGLILGFGTGFLVALAGGGKAAVFITVLLVCLALCAASVWLGVRLSLAGPLTLLRGKIIIGEAWRLTRGRFWTLFGGYLVVMLVVVAVLVVFFGLAMGSYFTALAHAAGDPVAIQAVAQEELKRMAPGSARWLLMLVPGGVLGGVAIVLQGAMTAIPARDLLAQRDV